MILGLERRPAPTIKLLRKPNVRRQQHRYVSSVIFSMHDYMRLMNQRIHYMKYGFEYKLRRKLEINDLDGVRGDIVFAYAD